MDATHRRFYHLRLIPLFLIYIKLSCSDSFTNNGIRSKHVSMAHLREVFFQFLLYLCLLQLKKKKSSFFFPNHSEHFFSNAW